VRPRGRGSFTPGNFKKDATMRPSHGRPRGHRPIVRPSENVRVTTLLWYPRGMTTSLQGFLDVDYGGDPDDRISTSAYIFQLGPTPISWCSKKQSSTARSSWESEYRALSRCTCEAIWLRRLVRELGFGNDQPTPLWCDNQSSIKIAKNPVFHDKTKHFEIDWHFTRQQVENGTIKVNFISTHDQPADILMKALT
jgi:hypothetical protein